MNRKFTVLMSHGNAEDITRVEDWVERVFLKKVRVNVMLYEYTGYGDGRESPEEVKVYADAEAALWFLTTCLKIPVGRVIAYGRSLGSGPSCYLAQHHPVGGLILQTPLTSVYRVILDFRFTLPGDMFPNIDRMASIRCPLMVIHGTRDEIVKMKHAEELFARCASARKSAFYVEGAGHNNIEAIAGAPFFESVQNFVDELEEMEDGGS